MGYLAVTFLGLILLSSQLSCSATWTAMDDVRSRIEALCSIAEDRLRAMIRVRVEVGYVGRWI